MNAETLLELAARCEAATGADRQIDFDISEAVGACYAYTASLDAAMTLVPEGWRTSGYHENEAADLPPHDWTLIERGEFERAKYAYGLSATAALALTAACLRARAASTVADTKGDAQ